MSKASILAIFLAISFALFPNQVPAQPPTEPTFTLAVCESELGNYTSNAYDMNLKTVLSTLPQQDNTTSTFFISTSVGTGPDAVHGQYYCRGDIGAQLCGRCLLQAASAALSRCPQAKAAAVFYQECTLHYSNETLLGVESIAPFAVLPSPTNVTDPSSLFDAANSTFTALSATVESGPDKFAIGDRTVSNVTVYCLVQCSPDLNATQCDSCLVSAANVMTTCCGEWPTFLYVFTPSCQLMYDTRAAFYFTSDAPTPPPS